MNLSIAPGPESRDLSPEAFSWHHARRLLRTVAQDPGETEQAYRVRLAEHVASLWNGVEPWHSNHPHPEWAIDGFTTRDILEMSEEQHASLDLTEDSCAACGATTALFWLSRSDLGDLICEPCRQGWVAEFDPAQCDVALKSGFSEELAYRAAHSGNCVYFVEGGGLVKIGRTGRLAKRLASLVTGSPIELKLIATAGPAELEAAYHALAKAKRVRLEWFGLSREEVFALPGVAPVLPAAEAANV